MVDTESQMIFPAGSKNHIAVQAALAMLCSERASKMHKMLQLRCMEHGCQLLLRDLREAMPWLRKCTKTVNTAIKGVRRSKKFFGKLKARSEMRTSFVRSSYWLASAENTHATCDSISLHRFVALSCSTDARPDTTAGRRCA